MKEKRWSLLWAGFISMVIIYLFIWSGFMGVLFGFGVKSFHAVKFHLSENTTITIYYIFRDTIIIGLLWSIWRKR